MPSPTGKPIVGPDWPVIQRPWGLVYEDPTTGRRFTAKEPYCEGGPASDGWALLESLTTIKATVKHEFPAPPAKAAPAVKKEPSASTSPPGFSFPSSRPFGASRAAPLTTFKASPSSARPAQAAWPARKRCTAAALAEASPAKRSTGPASLPARVGGAGASAMMSPAAADAAISNEPSLGCGSQARSDSSSPGYSITLSPPIHHTPPHPSCGEVRSSSSSSGSGLRTSAAPRSPTEYHPDAAAARRPAAARSASGNACQGAYKPSHKPLGRLHSKVQYKIKTICAYTGNRLRVEHFGEAAVRKLEKLPGKDSKRTCLDLVAGWFKREFDGGRVTHVSRWLLRALDTAASAVMQEI